jgi:hypothetical protein
VLGGAEVAGVDVSPPGGASGEAIAGVATASVAAITAAPNETNPSLRIGIAPH